MVHESTPTQFNSRLFDIFYRESVPCCQIKIKKFKSNFQVKTDAVAMVMSTEQRADAAEKSKLLPLFIQEDCRSSNLELGRSVFLQVSGSG